MKITKQDIIKLREETGAGVMEAKNALEETGDFDKAKVILKKKGLEKAAEKSERTAKQGLVYSYIHGDGKIGVLLELNCETDFVSRGEEFQTLAKEIAMQIAAMNPKDVQVLLKQPHIKDEENTIADLVNGLISKVGENIVIRRFIRYQLGE